MNATRLSFLTMGLLLGCGASVTPEPGSAKSLIETLRDGNEALVAGARGQTGAGLKLLRHGDDTFLLERFADAHARLTSSKWSYEERGDERLQSFTVHPSGEVTLALEHRDDERDTYELVRFDARGVERHRWRLASSSLPSEFLMKGVPDGSVIRGWLPWVELQAHGEDVVAAVLTRASLTDDTMSSAVVSLEWTGTGWHERWSQVLDGIHAPIAVAWQYDEFLWLDAATRVLLAVRDDGSVIAGRTFDGGRCRATFSKQECRAIQRGSAHRFQPFAWTPFAADGTRGATRTVSPDAFEEFVVFDMAVRGHALALVGTATVIDPETGEPKYYLEAPDSTPMTPYDGYLAVFDTETGTRSHQALVDLGRAEHLSTVRWTNEGLLAGGGAGWNRWWGGMSISRGATPLLVLDPLDGGAPLLKPLAVPLVNRHAHILALDTKDGEVFAAGAYDAPMTHSGDSDSSQMELGGFTLHLH